MDANVVSTISVVGVIGSLIFTYIAFFRASKKDTRDDGNSTGVIMTELKNIKSGIEDIKGKQDASERRYIDLAVELGKVSECAKSAHKRLDELNEKIK